MVDLIFGDTDGAVLKNMECLTSDISPQSNGGAKVAVRSTKRLLEDNVKNDGGLVSNRLIRTLLQLRNTPAPDGKIQIATNGNI